MSQPAPVLAAPVLAAPVLALNQYLDRWAKAHLACAPADRATAEAGVRLAYAAAGLPPPNRIVWCGGPLEMVRHLRQSSALDNPGRNVKLEVFDRLRTQVGTLAEIFWKEIIIAAGASPHRQNVGAAVDGHEQAKAVAAAVNRLVHSAVLDDLSRLSVRLRQAFSRLRGRYNMSITLFAGRFAPCNFIYARFSQRLESVSSQGRSFSLCLGQLDRVFGTR